VPGKKRTRSMPACVHGRRMVGRGAKSAGGGEIRKAGSRRRGSKDLHEYEEVGGRRSRGGGRRALLFGQDLAGGLKRRRLQ
jgi:hypothetical protein